MATLFYAMFFILAKSPTPLEMLLILPSKIFWNMAGSPAMFAYTIVAIHVRRCSNRFSPTPIDVIEFADVTGYNSTRCIFAKNKISTQFDGKKNFSSGNGNENCKNNLLKIGFTKKIVVPFFDNL